MTCRIDAVGTRRQRHWGCPRQGDLPCRFIRRIDLRQLPWQAVQLEPVVDQLDPVTSPEAQLFVTTEVVNDDGIAGDLFDRGDDGTVVTGPFERGRSERPAVVHLDAIQLIRQPAIARARRRQAGIVPPPGAPVRAFNVPVDSSGSCSHSSNVVLHPTVVPPVSLSMSAFTFSRSADALARPLCHACALFCDLLDELFELRSVRSRRRRGIELLLGAGELLVQLRVRALRFFHLGLELRALRKQLLQGRSAGHTRLEES